MDEFEVLAADTAVLDSSPLVNEMQDDLPEAEFMVYIEGEQYPFHDIDGGLHDNDYHIVNLIHRPEGYGEPPNRVDCSEIDVATHRKMFHLHSKKLWQFGDYPDEDFILSLGVGWYDVGIPVTDE
jgi:hypothetical protein